jgi:hypothetical protein
VLDGAFDGHIPVNAPGTAGAGGSPRLPAQPKFGLPLGIGNNVLGSYS